jgi:hypothetical protein
MRVNVETPIVSGDTVVFRWTQSEPNPYQYENCFYLRYDGLDLTRFSSALFFEVFLGLQLKVFAAYGKDVEVVFPEPVPQPSVAFWQAFHNAERVAISPIADVTSYSPWASGEAPQQRPRPFGVLFGGGKDSTLATCLFSELYGADQVALLQFVAPQRPGELVSERMGQRQEELMLRPAREQLGVVTQRAWTDYLAQHHKSGLRMRPHLELYTAGLLPALLEWGVSTLTTSFPWTAYPIRHLANGQVWFRYPKSRPEILATQSTHYRRVLGADLTLTNINLLFTTFTSYRMLVERYPAAFQQIVMCVAAAPGERWCYDCHKCGEYAQFGLANGIVDPRFDYDRLFGSSRYMRKVIEYLESGVELSVFGNAPWQKFFGSPTNYLVDCHAIAKLSPDLIADRIGIEARVNLMLLKAAFGNRAFPTSEHVPAKAVDLLGHEPARRIAGIAAEHFEVVDPLAGPFLSGNTEVEYDFTVRMPTKTGQLDHIRTEPPTG